MTMFNDEPEIFVLNGVQENNCLGHYFSKQAEKIKKNVPGELAESDITRFQERVINLTSQLDTFLKSNQKEVAYLALGKIQSGKTAHMMGVIAWASDSQISLVTIFTGVTEALNAQTTKRLRKDLTLLGDNYITTHEVPTSTKSPQYRNLYSEINRWVQDRLDNDLRKKIITPIPVLVTLKNPSRVKTLKTLISTLQKVHGSEIVSLLIDDEADQASQNAGANKRRITATYDSIKELRNLPNRNILISYTATPQAVLLTDKNGRLRPNHCVLVKPGHGYFGLEQVVGEEFKQNTFVVNDYEDEPSSWEFIPNSLKTAVIQFIWTGWLRFHEPEIFYHQSGLSGEQLKDELASVQMLIHESSRIIQHEHMFRHVSKLKDQLTVGLQDALMGTLNNAELESLENEWIEILEQTLKNLPIELMTRVHKEFNMEKVKQLYTLTKHLNLIIVNSDPNRSNSHLELPDDDGGWNSTKMWILIGGDILGRGLTIPQLTVTYFLRHPNKPNFDTVSQQMRFCGYRYRYSKFVFIHCQDHTFTMFEYMHEIDSTIWRRAEIWDFERLDILSTLPAVLYASRGGIRLEPVRKSVTDPDLIDQKITENIFSLRSIFDPNDFRLNLSTLKSFIFEEKLNQTEIDHELWKEYIEPTSLQFQRIISTWTTPDPREYSILIGAAELFNEEMGELGLANVPKRIFVRKNLFNPVDSFTEFKSFVDSIDTTRRVSLKHYVHNIENWSKLFMHGMTINQKIAKWPTLAVPHVGEGQRKMRDDLDENASILIIEPILGLEKTRERSSTLAIGCAFTLMSPLEFDLRLIGHRV